jgi:hypothetical protein
LANTGWDATKALLSFWGEPFMSRSAGRDVTRYIVRVDGSSGLIECFGDLERAWRADGRDPALGSSHRFDSRDSHRWSF